METLFWIALAIVGIIGLICMYFLLLKIFKPFFIWFQQKRIKHFQDYMIEQRSVGCLSKEQYEAMQNQLKYLNDELTQLHKF